MTLVVDASAVVAALVDDGRDGVWAKTELMESALIAPHVMPLEAANILRRSELSGRISSDSAVLAHGDLLDLRVALFAYEPFAPRVWELRHNLSSYDAWYVALAESFGVALATLDRRMARAVGPRCEFRLPRALDTLETGME